MQVHYNHNLKLVPLEDGENWEVAEDFAFLINKDVFTIPKGTIVNGASIPRFLWWFIGSPMTGKYRYASVIHDWLYQTKIFDRKKSDEVFYSAMLYDDTNIFKAGSMYQAVRAFGGSHYG